MKLKVRRFLLNNYSLLFVLTAVNLLIQFMPLTSELGYEFALVNSILFFLLGGFLYYRIEREGESLRQNLVIILLMVFVPLVISAVNTLLVKGCPICFGMPHYFVIAVPALFFGMAVIKFIGYLFGRFVLLIFFLVILLLVLIPVMEIYIHPQIYFYHFIIGYFPGTMYDDLISVDGKMLLYRFCNILFAGVIVYLSANVSTMKKKFYAGVIVLFAVILWLGVGKNVLGFVTYESDIESELSHKIESEHFEIYVSPEIKDSSDAIKAMHEFYFDKLTNELKIKLDGKIKSYIFHDKNQKKRLFGSMNADVAKPWSGQIYLDGDSYQYTVKHEQVHILAGEFGVTPFKVAAGFNPSLIEGVAVAFENDFGEKNIHYFAKTAIESGYDLKMNDLFSGFSFFTQNPSLSYLYAGSFIKYLSDKFGGEKIKDIYSGSSFDEVYGRSIGELDEEYHAFIDSLDYTVNENTARLYFGTPPLIEKKCPRFAALLSREAWEKYNEKKYDEAEEKFRELYKYTNTYDALNGLMKIYTAKEEYDSALTLLQNNFNRFEKSSYLYLLEIQSADYNILAGDTSTAKSFIDALEEQAPNQSYYMSALFRKLLFNSGVNNYKEYLLGEDKDRLKILGNLSTESDVSSLLVRITSLAEETGESISLIDSLAERMLKDSSFNSCYAAYEFSRYSFLKGNFETALKFAIFAVENNSRDEYSETFSENLELINWSKKYFTDESN